MCRFPDILVYGVTAPCLLASACATSSSTPSFVKAAYAFSAFSSAPSCVAVSDFDSDGLPDAVSCFKSRCWLYVAKECSIANANGLWRHVPASCAVNAQMFGFSSAEVPAVLLINKGPYTTAAWTDKSASYLPSVATTMGIGSICIGDIDNNGREDMYALPVSVSAQPHMFSLLALVWVQVSGRDGCWHGSFAHLHIVNFSCVRRRDQQLSRHCYWTYTVLCLCRLEQ